MGKAVKKVVKVAAPIAIGVGVGYATGGFGAGGFLTNLSPSSVLQIGGAGLNLFGNIQQQKYAKKTAQAISNQTEAANKADAARNRYNQLLQERSKLAQIRQARINQGQNVASMGGSGLGSSGTSSFTGSVGSVGTQVAANLGMINVAQSTGDYITTQNQLAANYGTNAANAQGSQNAWNSMASLGDTLFTKGPQLASIFGKA
jgi:hypothetical protein